MNEFIKKIIERLEKEKDVGYVHGYHAGRNDAFDDAIEIINQAAEEYKNGWIFVSSRKFPNETFVLCDVLYKDKDGNEFHEIEKLRYEGNGKFYNSWNDEQNVIAWQPLPELYQLKETEV